jgi:hypothetical protein
MGLGSPLDLPVFRAGIETELLTRFPRFRSIQVILKALVLTFLSLRFFSSTKPFDVVKYD